MRTAIRRLALAGLIACGVVFGQAIVSSIVGRVADSSGAGVPGAQITVTNTETGISVQTTTGSEGTYSVPGLLSGTYNVNVEKSGFQSYTAAGITLHSSETARVDVPLSLSGMKQTVSVVERAPMIQTDSMTIGTSVTTQQLEELPTSVQTIDAFIALAPGVQAYGSAGNPPIGGGRNWGSVNFTLNGVEVNDPGNSGGVLVQNWKSGTNALLVLPPPSAVQELNVQSGGMTAQYRGKSTVTIVTKGGTNLFHGGLYENFQNSDLNANDFTLNAAGNSHRPAEHLNQYGGNIGGPIKREKAFFFFDYSGFRRAYEIASQLRLPSAAMRNGDFSALCTGQGGSFANGICSNGNNQLYNPFTENPFPNNQIPGSMITPQSQKLLTYLPLPTVANSPGLPNGVFNYISTVGQQSRIGAWDLRMDYNVSTKDRLFGVFARRVADPLGVAGAGYPSNYGSRVNLYKETSATLSETHTFSPSTLNEFRASWGNYSTKFAGINLDFDTKSLWPQMPDSPFKGLPTITASGYTGLWYDYGSGPVTPRLDVELADDFTHIHGKHTIQAGADETGYKMFNRADAAGALPGAFGFTGTWTGNSGWPNLPHSNGNSFADFLLGTANSSQTSATGAWGPGWTYSRYWGFYAQDTWQATPRLTIIYGLRYEYQSPWRFRTPQITSIDLRNGKLVLPENSATPTLPAGAQADLFAAYPFETTQSIGVPLFYDRGDKNNFAPRIGFAFRPFNDQRTVIRGGYGVYYNFQPDLVGSAREGFNPPWAFGITQSFTTKLPGKPATAFMPDIVFSNPFPGVNAGSNVTPNPTLWYFQWDFQNAMVQEWNFTIEHQLGNLALRASYLGDQTHHIPANAADLNRPLVQQPNVPIQNQRPYQPWATIQSYLSLGKQSFNQLQLGAQMRFSRGLSFQAQYQFTRSLDNIDNSGGPDNPGSWNLSYGNTPGVRRHWLVYNYIYELPFGNNAHGLIKVLAGGWQISGISTYGTGTPFSVTYAQTGTGIVGWSGTRADQLSGVSFYNKQSGHDINSGVQWFNTSAFAPPAKWTWGNSARNMLWGPGLWNWDISGSKSFALRERFRLQVRADFLDAFNHFNLSNPNASIPDTRDGGTPNPRSGKITSGSGSRIVQLGLKLSF